MVAVRAAVASSTAPQPTVEITSEFLDGLMLEARSHNPAIGSAVSTADAAASAVAAVRTWDDPMVKFGYDRFTNRGMNPAMMGDIVYGVEQKLPVFDRPKLARQVAAADATKEKLNVDYETAKLRRDLITALLALALEDRTTDLIQQDLGWLEAMLSTVDHRYRVGKASQVEWLKIQTDKAKTIDRLKTLKLEREHSQVEVNRLLNRDLHAPWPTVALPSLPAPLAYNDALVNAAMQAEPKLKIMRQEIARAEAVSRATRQQRKPEIGVGLEGRSYSGDAGLRAGMVTVNFTLPWLNSRRYDSDFQRDRARVRASEQDAADRLLSIREELHHLIVELDNSRRQALLYQGELIPLTEQTLASASTAWANSLGVFQDVLDARRMLIENRLTLARSLAEQAVQRAEISLLTGTTDFSAFVMPVTADEKSTAMPMLGESK